jgi:hypothetical protein
MLYSKFIFDEHKMIDFLVNECNLVYVTEENYPALAKRRDSSAYHLFLPNSRMVSPNHTSSIAAMFRRQNSIHVAPAIYLFLHPYVDTYWDEKDKLSIHLDDDFLSHEILMHINDKDQFFEEVKHQFDVLYKKIKPMENEIRRKMINSASEEYKV